MSYCAVRTKDGKISKVVKRDGSESKLFNAIAKHPLIKTKEAALDIFKNKFSKVVEDQAAKTQNFFGDVVTGRQDKYIPSKPFQYDQQFDEKQEAFRNNYEPHLGNFDEHIATSIPSFRDVQVKKGAAIVETIGSGLMIDLGGSEGSLVKAVTQTSNGAIKTINVEPQEKMVAAHNNTPVEGSRVEQAAFYQGVNGTPAYNPSEKADVVHESMLFQFITPERTEFVKEVKDKYLKDDGLFITEEKFQSKDKAAYQKNEIIKNKYHKAKYFTEEQVRMKGEDVLVGMQENQARFDDYVKILQDNFEYVQVYWTSGNFKGVVATNDKAKFDKFMESIGDTNSRYSTGERVGTNGQITTDTQVINKSLMDLQKPKISLIFASSSDLVNSENPRENRNIQEAIQQEQSDLQELIDCLW